MSNHRLSRVQQTQRNRELLLGAARRVFLTRGYHAATLEHIAEEAGFSKGVVYSQFQSKADLFLALLEARIDERAAINARVVEGHSGEAGIDALLRHVASFERAEPEWGLLVIEFRIHAARHPDLNRRYAAAHARTCAGVERIVTRLFEDASHPPPLTPAAFAHLVLAVGAGARLEEAAEPESIPVTLFAELLAQAMSSPAVSEGPTSERRRVA